MPATQLSTALCHFDYHTYLNGLENSNELILLQVLLLGWCLTC